MDTDGGGPREWDFFISYAQADRAWAVWLAWVLEEAGYRVLVQAWDFVPGSHWVKRMQDGTEGAARTIAVLSDDYLKSVYGGAEWQAAWAADPAGAERKLLPVGVRECARPRLLAGVTGFDLFGLSEAEAKSLLLSKVRSAVAGRAKPAVKPGLPSPAALRTRPGHWTPTPASCGSDIDLALVRASGLQTARKLALT